MTMTKTEKEIYDRALEVGTKFEKKFNELDEKHTELFDRLIKMKDYLTVRVEILANRLNETTSDVSKAEYHFTKEILEYLTDNMRGMQ